MSNSGKKQSIDDTNEFNNPEEYEKKYVHDIYTNIAEHFDNTRHTVWPKIKEFLLELDENSIMFEVGCGNGKNLGISRGKSMGCDNCLNLLNIAKKKGHDVVYSDALNVEINDNYADVVLSIAVIHHFCTEERRLKAINELIRICKPNGRILIYVWAKNDNLNTNDNYVLWENKNEIQKRYYHFFDNNELDALCLKTQKCTVEKSYFDRENFAVIIKKI